VKPAAQFPDDRFTLVITEWAPGVGGGPATTLSQETWAELSMSPGNLRYVETVLAASTLVSADVSGAPAPAPAAGTSTGSVSVTGATVVNVSGKAIRLSVDQGTATDHVLFPTEDPPVAHSVNDVKAEINGAGSTWPDPRRTGPPPPDQPG
jgi:hypothetical protein